MNVAVTYVCVHMQHQLKLCSIKQREFHFKRMKATLSLQNNTNEQNTAENTTVCKEALLSREYSTSRNHIQLNNIGGNTLLRWHMYLLHFCASTVAQNSWFLGPARLWLQVWWFNLFLQNQMQRRALVGSSTCTTYTWSCILPCLQTLGKLD